MRLIFPMPERTAGRGIFSFIIPWYNPPRAKGSRPWRQRWKLHWETDRRLGKRCGIGTKSILGWLGLLYLSVQHALCEAYLLIERCNSSQSTYWLQEILCWYITLLVVQCFYGHDSYSLNILHCQIEAACLFFLYLEYFCALESELMSTCFMSFYTLLI